MKVDGLTIYHVKSHLQKYRTARYKPDLSEGFSLGLFQIASRGCEILTFFVG